MSLIQADRGWIDKGVPYNDWSIMTYENDENAGRLLWQKIDHSSPPRQGESLDLLIVAAWLEGTVTNTEREQVERWLARTPDAIDLISTALDEETDAADIPPQRVLDLAMDLVDANTATPIFSLPLIGSMGRLAAAVAICVLGFQLGRLASTVARGEQDSIVGDFTFNVFADPTSIEVDMTMLSILGGGMRP